MARFSCAYSLAKNFAQYPESKQIAKYNKNFTSNNIWYVWIGNYWPHKMASSEYHYKWLFIMTFEHIDWILGDKVVYICEC